MNDRIAERPRFKTATARFYKTVNNKALSTYKTVEAEYMRQSRQIRQSRPHFERYPVGVVQCANRTQGWRLHE